MGGIIWIITGLLAATVTLILAFQQVFLLQGQAPNGTLICGFLLGFSTSLFGLIAGILTLTGGPSRLRVSGAISILFFLLFFGATVLMVMAGADGGRLGRLLGRFVGDLVAVMVAQFALALYGVLFLLAASLALSGRSEYARYRADKRSRTWAEGRHEDARPRPPRTTCPGTSMAGGTLWIISGSVMVLPALGLLFMVSHERIWVLPWLLASVYSLIAGIRTVGGWSATPIVNVAITILLALTLIWLGTAVIQRSGSSVRGIEGFFATVRAVLGGFLIANALLMLLAGGLVLTGRKEYIRYRAYRQQQRLASGDRRDYEDDDDEE